VSAVEVILVAIIVVLLSWIFLPGWKLIERRKLAEEMNKLEREIRRLSDENVKLKAELFRKPEEEANEAEKISCLVRDLERLRSAMAGAKTSWEELQKKYGTDAGPELVKRILQSQPGVSWILKEKLAQEILVGEVGRSVLRALASSPSIENASVKSGAPLAIVKNEIKRLQTLGYLDDKLNPTDLGKMVI